MSRSIKTISNIVPSIDSLLLQAVLRSQQYAIHKDERRADTIGLSRLLLLIIAPGSHTHMQTPMSVAYDS